MIKNIILNMEYLNSKKLKKSDELNKREALFKDSVSNFKKEMKVHLSDKSIKIIKETWVEGENSISIEFAESIWQKIYDALIKAPSVETIDTPF